MKLPSIPLVFLLVTGCASHLGEVGGRPLPPSQANTRTALQRFNQFLIADGVVLFESWNGTRKGMDCDFRIRLLPENRMVLEEDGIGPMTFRGTYELVADGRLRIFVPSYKGSWPAMVMKMERNVLKLRREDGETWLDKQLELGPDFWPFACKNRIWRRVETFD